MGNNDPISYDQLKAMMEVQSKNTEQMVLVADRLKEIVDVLKGIAPKVAITEENKKTLGEIKVTVDSVKDKTNTLLIIYSSLTGLVAIAFLFVQIVNWNDTKKSKAELAAQNTYLHKIQKEGIDRGMLQEQIKEEVDKLQRLQNKKE